MKNLALVFCMLFAGPSAALCEVPEIPDWPEGTPEPMQVADGSALLIQGDGYEYFVGLPRGVYLPQELDEIVNQRLALLYKFQAEAKAENEGKVSPWVYLLGGVVLGATAVGLFAYSRK